ncbi:carbohydrate ABC transporter permease [Kiritimatiellaeota bacterium B1221]|nr:carbohydrate ABC transporter permease [Kiritimatiellaeota bacterium B1221]
MKFIERSSQVMAYVLLTVCACITLVPFIWLGFAALRNPEVYFDFQFIPRVRHVQMMAAPEDSELRKVWTAVLPSDGMEISAAAELVGADLVNRARNEHLIEYRNGKVAWDMMSLQYFRRLLSGNEFPFVRSFLNSVFYASVTAVFATLFCAMGGYALAKFEFKCRTLFTRIVLMALVIPGSLLLAPGYQLLFKLGLLDSYWGLILPGLAPAFGVFLFRQSMLNAVPTELMESARIDGCGEIRLFFEMILPMVRPMLGAFLLITFLGCWNNFIGPQIVLQTPSKFPLAVAIAQLKGIYSTEYGLLMAGTILSIAPVMALFLLLQKEFISGLTSGAVKG